MKPHMLMVAVGLALLTAPMAARAQGVVRGAQEGAAVGSRAAGPVGGAVGGAVGGVAGGVAGGVKGVLGIPQDTRTVQRSRTKKRTVRR
jgi:phage tail tape-measure protein